MVDITEAEDTMGVSACCQEIVVKKGSWSPEEDHKLTKYINKYGPGNWPNLPKLAGLLRGAKSCRLRWINYLRPGIKRGPFSPGEDEIIIHYHDKIGNKWSEIAKQLPGRTDNDIKNRWYTHLKKGQRNIMAYKRVSPLLTSSCLARLETEARIGRSLLSLAANGTVHLEHNLLNSIFQSKEIVPNSVALNYVDQEQQELLSYKCQRLDKNVLGEDQLMPCSTKFNAEMLNEGGDNYSVPAENNWGDSISACLSSTYNGADDVEDSISSFPLLNMNIFGAPILREPYLEFAEFPGISREIVEFPTTTDFMNIADDKEYYI